MLSHESVLAEKVGELGRGEMDGDGGGAGMDVPTPTLILLLRFHIGNNVSKVQQERQLQS